MVAHRPGRVPPCHHRVVTTSTAEPTGRLDGRVALVTGAGSGIGRATAGRLALEGADVVVTDLDEGAAGEVAASLPGRARRLALGLDVTDTGAVDGAVEAAGAAFGGVDVLVNVAGGDVAHPAFELTDDATWTSLLDLNLLGVVRCCRAAVPRLRRSRHGGTIVNVSSVNAMLALSSEPYSAAKAGVIALTRNLAVSLAPEVRVNAVAPGTVRTRVWDDQPGGADRMRSLYPLGRVGEPTDIAAAIAFLVSDDAAWITGHTLPVDGGLLAGPSLQV